MPAREPLKFYRVWCGRKRYSGWLPDRLNACRVGARHGLVFFDERTETYHLGPLTWLEAGTRKYARSRTIPQPR